MNGAKVSDAALSAVSDAETMLGKMMTVAIMMNAHNDRDIRMSQVMVTAGLIHKLKLGLTEIGMNLGPSVQAVLDQLDATGPDAEGMWDLTDIVIPNGPDDYINQAG